MQRHKAKVAVIDYGLGNLFSIKRACEEAGLDPLVTCEGKDISGSDALILPGVGAFAVAMENLSRLDLISPIMDFFLSGRPMLGICLGMQLLVNESEEFGRHKGLGIIPGRVLRFPDRGSGSEKVKVPQICWNRIFLPSRRPQDYWKHSLLSEIDNAEFMYFVHSFYVSLEDEKVALSVSRYAGIEYCSSLAYKNIYAVQFHPERSGPAGLKIYRNWLNSHPQDKEQ